VIVTVNGYSEITNASGSYRIDIPTGIYNITTYKQGYGNLTALVFITENFTTVQDFHLLPEYQATIESCNPDGGRKDLFQLNDTVYVTGNFTVPFTLFEVYVIYDEATWSNGMPIPSRVPGTTTIISSNADGHIPPTEVWSEADVVGAYDVVVDVNANGHYDPEIDALDDSDVEVTAGFIIPEFPTLIITTLFMLASLAGAAANRSARVTIC
jgi:hypothetical protein